jgi:hypothetical protein
MPYFWQASLMHIKRQTPEELVVVSGTRWISAVCAAAALIVLYFVVTRHQPTGIVLVAFLLLFTVIMDLRKTFTFDATRCLVRWSGRKVFSAESGEIPFDDISEIGSEVRRVGNRNVPTYRLTIITSQATIPMAYTYNGQVDGYAVLRQQILTFIKPTSTR